MGRAAGSRFGGFGTGCEGARPAAAGQQTSAGRSEGVAKGFICFFARLKGGLRSTSLHASGEPNASRKQGNCSSARAAGGRAHILPGSCAPRSRRRLTAPAAPPPRWLRGSACTGVTANCHEPIFLTFPNPHLPRHPRCLPQGRLRAHARHWPLPNDRSVRHSKPRITKCGKRLRWRWREGAGTEMSRGEMLHCLGLQHDKCPATDESIRGRAHLTTQSRIETPK